MIQSRTVQQSGSVEERQKGGNPDLPHAQPPRSDEELMQAVQRGDLAAFEQIVLRHQVAAWNTACRFLNDPAEAEDVAQEAFLRVLDAAPRYQPIAKFKTYFLQIVGHLCLDRLRKKHPAYVENLPERAAQGEPPDDLLMGEERRRSVHQAVEQLPAQQRLALILRYDRELSYQEIAAVLQVSAKAVERLLARGRVGVAAVLAGSPQDENRNKEGVFRQLPV